MEISPYGRDDDAGFDKEWRFAAEAAPTLAPLLPYFGVVASRSIDVAILARLRKHREVASLRSQRQVLLKQHQAFLAGVLNSSRLFNFLGPR